MIIALYILGFLFGGCLSVYLSVLATAVDDNIKVKDVKLATVLDGDTLTTFLLWPIMIGCFAIMIVIGYIKRLNKEYGDTTFNEFFKGSKDA